MDPWYIRMAEERDIPRPVLLRAIRARVGARLRRERRGGADAVDARGVTGGHPH